MMRIGLVLSGGGTRAAVFHLGVLKRLAEAGRLEDVSRISTVSGGSLLTALVFSRAGMKWPSSRQYLEEILPQLEDLLTSKSLLTFCVLLLSPGQWFRINHRARIVANLLAARWGVTGDLSELPEEPKWEINTTTLETGKNWYFSKTHMGDWVYGKHANPPFSIAEACAASAAVPYVLGALKLAMPESGWRSSHYSSTKQLEERPGKVRLWDGGVYENLGLERICKPGQDMQGCDFAVISDASAPLKLDQSGFFTKLFSIPWRMVSGKLTGPRLFDVASEQVRSLRVRMFFSDLFNDDRNTEGVHIRLGNPVRQLDKQNKFKREEGEYENYQNEEEVRQASGHATTLSKLGKADFDCVCRHGYEAAEATFQGMTPHLIDSSFE